jgi:serine/threonine protein phosphatase PrpC
MPRLPPPTEHTYLGAFARRAPPPQPTPSLGHRLTVTGLSDIGRVRNRNEDSLSLVPELGIAVLADGMGGHPGGDVASRIAAETTVSSLRHLLPPDGFPDPESAAEQLGRAMAESVLWAHRAVRAEGAREPALEGMGTTLTALVADAATGAYAIGHVGDSRAYRLRGGELVQLTRDDTWVQQRVEEARLTPEQARDHPFGHMLTQCVGLPEQPDPHLLTGGVEAGDVYLLCTDGLTGMLRDSEVEACLSVSPGDEPGGRTWLRRLVDQANSKGGHDNITAALVLVDEASVPGSRAQ